MSGRVCIADRIRQYVDHCIDKLSFRTENDRNIARERALKIYVEVRINPEFINGQNPMGMAGGIVYYTLRLLGYAGRTNGKFNITAHDVAQTLGISEVAVGKHFKRMKTSMRTGGYISG